MIETDITKTRVYQEGYEQGLAEGRKEVRKLVLEEGARKMLKLGWSIEEIASATTLTTSQIRKLMKNTRKKA